MKACDHMLAERIDAVLTTTELSGLVNNKMFGGGTGQTAQCYIQKQAGCASWQTGIRSEVC